MPPLDLREKSRFPLFSRPFGVGMGKWSGSCKMGPAEPISFGASRSEKGEGETHFEPFSSFGASQGVPKVRR